MSYWYLNRQRDDHQFCWARHPTFVCHFQEGLPSTTGPIGAVLIEGYEPTEHDLQVRELRQDAERLGITRLSEMIESAHRRGGISKDGYRLRLDDGTLTDRCRVCGGKLQRKGFAAWEERPPTDEDEGPSKTMAVRLGFNTHVRVGKTRYFRTKKKAEEWARKQTGG